jgi:hypothetical protein
MIDSQVVCTDVSCDCAGSFYKANTPHHAKALRYLRLKLFHNAGAITMLIGIDTHPLQHRQPHVA